MLDNVHNYRISDLIFSQGVRVYDEAFPGEIWRLLIAALAH